VRHFKFLQLAIESTSAFADFGGGGHYISGSRGTAERRSLLEVNHNKAITKKLVSAIHYQQVSCQNPPFVIFRMDWRVDSVRSPCTSRGLRNSW
jgi:hypothetical protein